MRFHLISLPWTRTNADHLTCAYTQRGVKFARMMIARGHEVLLYSGIQNTAPCTEHVVVITPQEQEDILGTTDAPWDPSHPAWIAMNARAAGEIARRAGPQDFLLLMTPAQMAIARALPHLTAVEYGIGYHHTAANFRVFESQAWRHITYGAEVGTTDRDGRFYDAVIPCYFDPADFHVAEADDYFLFIGRGIKRKGPQIAADVCEYLGARLILAGHDLGGFPTYGERVGPVGSENRAALMAGAIATFVPTEYIGPFEGVAVEALMSGCPVICTDFGAFTETVQAGDGWRCNTMAEFVDAARAAMTEASAGSSEVRSGRRDRAIARYSLDAVAPMYERYFQQLLELWGEGFPALEHPTI